MPRGDILLSVTFQDLHHRRSEILYNIQQQQNEEPKQLQQLRNYFEKEVTVLKFVYHKFLNPIFL